MVGTMGYVGVVQRQSRRLAALAILFAVATAAAPWAFRIPSAAANHPTGGYKHLYYMHWSAPGHDALDEDYCADSDDNVIGDTTFLVYVNNTLLYDGNHWDQTGSQKIDLWPAISACNSYLDDSWIEIEYHSNGNLTATCGDVNTSCAQGIDVVGGYHYRYYNVYMLNTHIDGGSSEYHQNINHESGHVWGWTIRLAATMEPARLPA
jgi:hypothetical protein